MFEQNTKITSLSKLTLRKIGVIRFYSFQSQLWGQLLPEPEHPVTLSEQEIICFCITFCTPNLCNLEVLLCINFSVLIDTSVVADTDGFIDANAAVVADPDANADAVTDADPNSHADADPDSHADTGAGADADADLLPFFWLSWPSCTATWCRKLWFNSIRECKPASRPSRLEASTIQMQLISQFEKYLFVDQLEAFCRWNAHLGGGGLPIKAKKCRA